MSCSRRRSVSALAHVRYADRFEASRHFLAGGTRRLEQFAAVDIRLALRLDAGDCLADSLGRDRIVFGIAIILDEHGPPRLTVLILNGNAGNRAHRGPLAAALHRYGLQVLLVDYRGYGGNPGTASESGFAADGRAALAYLVGRSDVDASRLVYFGESLGAAVAVGLAVEHPPAALILRSPFTSMADVGRHHYPFLPVRLLLRDRFPSIDRIHRIRSPLLVIAGDHDRIVPIQQSRRLYEAASAQKTLIVVPEADHNDYELLAGDQMIQAIVRFLQPLT